VLVGIKAPRYARPLRAPALTPPPPRTTTLLPPAVLEETKTVDGADDAPCGSATTLCAFAGRIFRESAAITLS